METHKPAVRTHSHDHFATVAEADRVVVADGLNHASNAKRREIPAACLAGFQRTFVIKRRLVPLCVSRFLARFR